VQTVRRAEGKVDVVSNRLRVATLFCAVLVVAGSGIGSTAAETAAPEAASAPDPVVARGDAYWRLSRAFFLAREQQMTEAIRDIRAALALEPDSADLKAEAAALLALLGQRNDAERVAREALAIDPNQKRALRVLGETVVNRALGSRDRSTFDVGISEAIDLFERLTEGDDADPDDLLLLARLQSDAGRFVDASRSARRLAEIRPSAPEVLDVLWRSLIGAGRAPEALEAIVDFLSRNPGPIGEMDLERTSDLVRRLIEEQDAWPLLADRGASLVEAHPEVTGLRVLYGEALLRAGRAVEAVEQLERAAALAPDDDERDPQLDYMLAAAYGSADRLADATELAERMLDRQPAQVALWNLLGETRTLRRDYAGAVEAFSQVLEAMGEDPRFAERRDEIRLRIAGIELAADRTDEAAAALAAIEVPDTVDAAETGARLALRQGDERALRQALRTLRGGNPEAAAVADVLEGEWLAREGRDARARDKYQRAAETLGKQVLARGAAVFAELDRPQVGESMLRAWVADEPDSPRARFHLGAFLEQEGRFDAALAELDRSLEIDPGSAEVLNYVGYSLADRDRDLPRALDLVERALTVEPYKGEFLDSLGWVYYRMGRYDDARRALERATRELPNDPTILEHLGDVHVRLDAPERAIEYWQRALALADPERVAAIRAKISELADRADLDGAVPD